MGVVIAEIEISMVVFVPLLILLAIISRVDPVSLALRVPACLAAGEKARVEHAVNRSTGGGPN